MLCLSSKELESEPGYITNSFKYFLYKPTHIYIYITNELTLTRSSSSLSAEPLDIDDFSRSLEVSNNETELFSPFESSEIFNRKRKVSIGVQSQLTEICKSDSSSSASVDSSSSSHLPIRLKKKMRRKSPDKMEESFFKLTSAVSTHLENKNPNVVPGLQ